LTLKRKHVRENICFDDGSITSCGVARKGKVEMTCIASYRLPSMFLLLLNNWPKIFKADQCCQVHRGT